MKLLNKPLRLFTLYALLILTLSIPVYYYVVELIWKAELDDHNQIVKRSVEMGLNGNQLNEAELDQSVALLNKINPGINLKPATGPVTDSAYYVLRMHPADKHAEYERFRGLYSTIQLSGRPYEITIETNVEEVDETLAAISVITLFFFLLLLAGFIYLNRRISNQIWKPFRTTLGAIKSFDLNSRHSIELETTNIQEFEELNAEIKKLVDRNIRVFKQQKEFTENASHELQTPLAVIKSRLDLLMQNPTLTREQSEMIEALYIPLTRVSRINKNLLLLAKIENQQFADNENINLSELVSDNLEFLSDLFHDKNLTVTQKIKAGVVLSANKSLLEILVTNLLLNAIRYNTAEGRLVIELTHDSLKISNTGTQALKSETLFKRFITSSIDSPSSGLGLAIVKQISNRYKWNVQYAFGEGLHIFEVSFGKPMR